MCARYQARTTEKHLHAVKRIFRYLRGTVNRGLWYPKDSLIALIAFADADHAGCQDTRRSTSGSISQPQSSGKSDQVEEHGLRVDDLEEPFHQEFNTGNNDVSPVREVTDVDERLWNPPGSQTPDREWHKTKTIDD
nr:uncharacterized mitochondrial protein AtMg00810-like [Tanacetum cinerariifolium]